MSLETSLSNIRIKNNTIDQGSFATGFTPVSYNYTSHAQISGSSVIEANTFIAPSASSNMLVLNSCSCTITSNKFIRGSTAITSYINSDGVGDHIIKDNIFDQTTIDGSNDNVVVGLTTSSTYVSNKNQIIYVPITLVGPFVSTDVVNGDAVNASSTSLNSSGSYTSLSVTGTGVKIYQFYVHLNVALPMGAQLLELKLGIFGINGGGATLNSASNSLSMTTTSQDVVRSNYSAGLNSILDSKNKRATNATTSTTSYDLDADVANLTTDTQYLTLTPSSPLLYKNTNNYSLKALVGLSTNLSVAGSGFSWHLSPLVAKCTW